jgi:hypothetical protein
MSEPERVKTPDELALVLALVRSLEAQAGLLVGTLEQLALVLEELAQAGRWIADPRGARPGPAGGSSTLPGPGRDG